MLATWQPLSAKVGNHFANKRRSLGRYTSLADSDHGVYLFFFFKFYPCMSLLCNSQICFVTVDRHVLESFSKRVGQQQPYTLTQRVYCLGYIYYSRRFGIGSTSCQRNEYFPNNSSYSQNTIHINQIVGTLHIAHRYPPPPPQRDERQKLA
jgi:hypothetical protein